MQDALSQQGKVGCQNWHILASAYSAAGGEHQQQCNIANQEWLRPLVTLLFSFQNVLTDLPEGYKLNIPRLNLLSSPEVRQPGKAPNYSVNWSIGLEQPEIVDAMKGKDQVSTTQHFCVPESRNLPHIRHNTRSLVAHFLVCFWLVHFWARVPLQSH